MDIKAMSAEAGENVDRHQIFQGDILVLTFKIFTPFTIFWWDWGLNSGLHNYKASALLLKPSLWSILLWLFWRWGLMNYLPGLV
jgi:hypothetical protein